MNEFATKKNSRELRKNIILHEAIALFAEKGYFATTISDIAKEANVSFGSVAYYFNNKEQLFVEAVTAPFADVKRLFEMINEVEGTPIQRISKMVNKQFISLTEQRTPFRLVQYVIGQKELFPELVERILLFFDELKEIVNHTIVEGQKKGELIEIDPNVVFSSYFSYLNGVMLTIMDEPYHPIWNEFVLQGIRLFGPRENVMDHYQEWIR
ncbi:TetR/AcrR family transcriptional regulator [Paucisalibacillus sp. EB02]|uniref:TetR/AcrR family transcriptional regulator n=1 Tax=Paucisalibacillus sp. EB02 TaxID=1347087 RepID=UPI0005AA9CE7|nr:TetR/AcrR family transcriptional regulator [Paucisalibacillus sp. EB02]